MKEIILKLTQDEGAALLVAVSEGVSRMQEAKTDIHQTILPIAEKLEDRIRRLNWEQILKS